MAKAKQQHLSGMEPPSIKAIDKAADVYVEARNARMNAGVREKERKIILAELMKQNGLTEYEYDGKIIRVLSKENVKVNEISDKEEED